MAEWAQMNVTEIDSRITSSLVKCEYKLPLILQCAFYHFFFRWHVYTGGLVGKLCIIIADWNLWEVGGHCIWGVKYFVAFV